MKKIKFIFLILLFVSLIFPWQLVCLSHPAGHNHHHAEGELSSCQKRTACRDLSLWPPMTCLRIAIVVDIADSPQNKFLFSNACTGVDLTESSLKDIRFFKTPLLKLPDPHANSDPPKSSIFLRGPPLV